MAIPSGAKYQIQQRDDRLFLVMEKKDKDWSTVFKADNLQEAEKWLQYYIAPMVKYYDRDGIELPPAP